MKTVACRHLPTDPPLEAPRYAQDEGASGGGDSWWCQLPHATQMPSKLTVVSRSVAPLPRLYGLYATEYTVEPAKASDTAEVTVKGKHKHVTIPAAPPTITVASTVDSAVAPGATTHPALRSGGKRVTVAKGVRGTLFVQGDTIEITWPYPTTGVPKYLQGVSTITVTGVDVPTSTVLAVARHVRPD